MFEAAEYNQDIRRGSNMLVGGFAGFVVGQMESSTSWALAKDAPGLLQVILACDTGPLHCQPPAPLRVPDKHNKQL